MADLLFCLVNFIIKKFTNIKHELQVNGFSKVKVEKYGKDILKILSDTQQ